MSPAGILFVSKIDVLEIKYYIALSILNIPVWAKTYLLNRVSFDICRLWDKSKLGENRWKTFFNEFREWELVENIYKRSLERGVKIVIPSSTQYPTLLKNIRDFPVVIFCRGNTSLLSNTCFSIVGSRNITPYGMSVISKFTPPLIEAGFCIVSGMARGVDAQAHRKTLDMGGKTIAVLGTGVDIPYPAGNKKLYNDILEGEGLIISEFPIGTRAFKSHFPQRNRIIAGLSEGVLIVEAGLRSGSLITASLAEGYSRDVFAVPGPVNSVLSIGVNNLIKSGAVVAAGPEGILEHYSLLIKENRGKKDISEKSRVLLKMFVPQGVDFNELLLLSGMQMVDILKSLDELQYSGYIGKDDFGIYYKIS